MIQPQMVACPGRTEAQGTEPFCCQCTKMTYKACLGNTNHLSVCTSHRSCVSTGHRQVQLILQEFLGYLLPICLSFPPCKRGWFAALGICGWFRSYTFIISFLVWFRQLAVSGQKQSKFSLMKHESFPNTVGLSSLQDDFVVWYRYPLWSHILW